MRSTLRARVRLVVAGPAVAMLAVTMLAACASPTGQASPPVSASASVVASSSVPAPTGPTVTVPQLPDSAPSSASSSPTPDASTPPSEAPVPAAPTTEQRDAVDDPADDATQTAAPPTVQPAPAAPTTARPAVPAGRTVVIDPGHNGANGANPDIINQQVDAGFGQTKNCNTTGTSTNDGYPEHAFNWGVAQALRDELEAAGVTVIMTRDSDTGVGPCVNQRANIGNQAGADAVISLHGDGADAAGHGFYVLTAERAPGSADTTRRSAALAADVRDGLVGSGLSTSSYLGTDGLWQRSDLAGLNLSLQPTVLIEFGNMRNSADAALMSSPAGQQQCAEGVAKGVLAYLG